MISLTEFLNQLAKDGVLVKRGNLTAKAHGRHILEALVRESLAEEVQEGQRVRWYVSPAALPRLSAGATGRPGPAPGAQVSLDADQIGRFCRAVVAAGGNPTPERIRKALSEATGIAGEALERINIPVRPRVARATAKSRSQGNSSNP